MEPPWSVECWRLWDLIALSKDFSTARDCGPRLPINFHSKQLVVTFFSLSLFQYKFKQRGRRGGGGLGGGRRAAPARSAAPPARRPQTNTTPAPMQQPSSGGGMLSGIGSTIAQGMAFGTGSAIAHRVRSMLLLWLALTVMNWTVSHSFVAFALLLNSRPLVQQLVPWAVVVRTHTLSKLKNPCKACNSRRWLVLVLKIRRCSMNVCKWIVETSRLAPSCMISSKCVRPVNPNSVRIVKSIEEDRLFWWLTENG